MWFTRTADGFRAWFRVETSQGLLRAGLTSGAFAITVRNPSDTASVSPAPTVTESGKSGLYRFDVPSSFLTTHGVGAYAVLIEVTATAPVLRATAVTVLVVDVNDFDSLATSVALVAVDASDVRKTLENREEIDFIAQELISYEDDGTTPRRRWPLETNGAEPVTTATGIQTKRKASTI